MSPPPRPAMEEMYFHAFSRSIRFLCQGSSSKCYIHPEDPYLCVKIMLPGKEKVDHRDRDYYKHLQRRGIPWDMIPRYYGDVATNLGRGSVFDLIVDQEGGISKSLEYYLLSPELTEAYYDGISKSLTLLKSYLFRNRIVTMHLYPKNIVCQRSDATISRLFLVDNIGNTDFIPICNYSRLFATIRLKKRWERFEQFMLCTYDYNEVLRKMVMASRMKNHF